MEQQCVEVELELSQKPKPTPAQVRNRRYRKLKELRAEGFFSEDSIKLRHPLLYHTYLGGQSQRSSAGQSNVNCTLSQFLQKNLINLEYRQKISEEFDKKMSIEDNKSEDWQLLQEVSGEVTVSKDGIRDTGIVRSWDIVEEEQIELQEQNLIDHAEELFLQGKVDENYINYAQIDNNSQYDEDELQEGDRVDAEQKYFNSQSLKEQDEKINREYYTGIQDY